MIRYLLEPGDHLTYPQLRLCKEGDYDLTLKDRNIKVYPSKRVYISYLFDGLTEALVREMKKNISDKLDNLLVIHGPEGSGKSHLAYHIARTFNPDFDMKKNYIYEYDEFLTRITEDLDSPPGTVYWLDEASNIANNRDWMHTDNKEFIKVLEMFRSRGWTLILCIPKLDRLDLYIRETRARYILKAAIMGWEGNHNKSRGYYSLDRVDFTEDYRSVRKIGYGSFPPISEPDLSIYEELKLKSQTRKIEELNDMKERAIEKAQGGSRVKELSRKNKAMLLAMVEDGYTYERIGEITGQSYQAVKYAVHQARKERDDNDT